VVVALTSNPSPAFPCSAGKIQGFLRATNAERGEFLQCLQEVAGNSLKVRTGNSAGLNRDWRSRSGKSAKWFKSGGGGSSQSAIVAATTRNRTSRSGFDEIALWGEGSTMTSDLGRLKRVLDPPEMGPRSARNGPKARAAAAETPPRSPHPWPVSPESGESQSPPQRNYPPHPLT
jgi:hypothetical protein